MKNERNSSQGQAPKVLIFLTVFLYLIGFGIIIPILPLLGRELGGSAAQVGWLMAVFSLMQFIFAPFWGQLSDRYGRRSILVGCLLAEALTYLWFAFARDFWSLLMARGLAGFFGASLSTASAYISDITPPKERSKGMALIGIAFGLGFIIGPAIGGGMIHFARQFSSNPLVGSTVAALFVGGLCFATFLFAYFKLPESLPPEKRVPNKKHQFNRFASILNKLRLAKLRPLMGTYLLTGLAMASMEATLILFVGQEFGWTPDKVSYGFAYIGLIMIFTQGFLVRRLLPIVGEKYLALAGLSFFTLGMAGISVAGSIGQLAFAMTLLSLGNGCVNPSILGSISLASSETEQGENLGVAQSLSSLGRILGPLLGGFLFDSGLVRSPFLASMVLASFALLIIITHLKTLPDSRVESKNDQKDTVALGQIGYFHLVNLKRNKVPFSFFAINFSPPEKIEGELQQIMAPLVKIETADLPGKLSELNLKADHPIVLLCERGEDSGKCADQLTARGFLNVYCVKGGWLGLGAEAAVSVSTDSNPTG